MGCAGSLAADIAEMKTAYAYANTKHTLSITCVHDAKTAWNLGQDHTAIGHLIDACGCFHGIHGMLIYRFAPFYPEYMLIHIIEAHLAASTLDMDTLLTAMIAANFEELQKFVGIADAYRVAVWNAPFNADFYAALARGFQQWP